MGLLGSFVNEKACAPSVKLLEAKSSVKARIVSGQYDDRLLPVSFYYMKTYPSVHCPYMGFTGQSPMDLSDPEERILIHHQKDSLQQNCPEMQNKNEEASLSLAEEQGPPGQPKSCRLALLV